MILVGFRDHKLSADMENLAQRLNNKRTAMKTNENREVNIYVNVCSCTMYIAYNKNNPIK
jgi:hypothetical protein